MVGKFARATAHVKNVTLDPTVKVSKFVGRKTKAGFVATKTGIHNGVEAVRTAESEIEEEKALKALFSDEETTEEDIEILTKPVVKTKHAAKK